MDNSEKSYIFERVFIETPVDTDKDGKHDLIAAYIKRPKTTLKGERVPVVFVANPYLMTCNEDWYVPHNVDVPIKAFETQNIAEEDVKYDFSVDKRVKPESVRMTKGFAETAEIEENLEFECIPPVYDHMVSRGYATIYSGGLGTRGSDGLTRTGSREEILAFKSVIDWLCGRCRAFTDKTSNIEIKADWSTGKVAMSGMSYLATMAIGVGMTGVEGLETIIPAAGISNWYLYYRNNGLNLPAIGWQGDDLDILAKYCTSRAKDEDDFNSIKELYEESQAELLAGEDRESGNYSKFWDERNYLNLIDNLKASVFIIHGLNDWNVMTNQCIPLFKALEERNHPRKMMLHQGEHTHIFTLKDSHTTEILDRWLDFYLKGIDTGADKEPKVLVESNLDQSKWSAQETWPPVESDAIFPVNASGKAVIVDDIKATCFDKEKDNLKEWRTELVMSEDETYKNRIKYVWNLEDFKGDVRYSGTSKVSFEAALDQKTGVLSAMLVDLGKDHRITDEEIEKDGEYTFGLEKEASDYKVITRGWMNPQNRNSIWSKEEIEEGKFYKYEFEMVPTDYLIKEGHKLALILYGIDAEATQRPETVTKITVKQESIKVSCPIFSA